MAHRIVARRSIVADDRPFCHSVLAALRVTSVVPILSMSQCNGQTRKKYESMKEGVHRYERFHRASSRHGYRNEPGCHRVSLSESRERERAEETSEVGLSSSCQPRTKELVLIEIWLVRASSSQATTQSQ